MGLDWEGFKSGLSNTLRGDFSNIPKNLNKTANYITYDGRTRNPFAGTLASMYDDVSNMTEEDYRNMVGPRGYVSPIEGLLKFTGLFGKGGNR
jgi:hypothetical protein